MTPEASRKLLKPAQARKRGSLSATYDSAQTTRQNQRHWDWARGENPWDANSLSVRKTLRNRARYEYDNNSYCRGIVTTLAADIVGPGPRIQIETGDVGLDNAAEVAFASWANSVGLPDLLTLGQIELCVAGEFFLVLVNGRDGLSLQLVPTERITTPYQKIGFSGMQNYLDGILYDDNGDPVEYDVCKGFPTNAVLGLGPEAFQTISADFVLHHQPTTRAGTVRSIPRITPALELFAQLRRYTLATVTSAEGAANITGVIEQQAPEDPDAETINYDALDLLDVERGTLMTLPEGASVSQLRAEQPTATYAEFKHELINEIARALDMPYNIAAANSGGYNYASGRLDHQTYFRAVSIEQARLGSMVLDPIFTAWAQDESLSGGYSPQSAARLRNATPRYMWRGHGHVDPKKEADAQAVRLANRTTTFQDEYAREGLDWRREFDKIAEAQAYADSLGISLYPGVEIEEAEDEDE